MKQCITAAQLQAWKASNPHNLKLQKVTIGELYANIEDPTVDFNTVSFKGSTTELLGDSWDCAKGIGFVVFDCVCLFLGAAALRDSATAEVAEDLAKAAEPVASQLEQYIKIMGDKASSTYDVAKAVFGVMSTIYSGSCMGAVISAFLDSLTWYNAILYGATALGTIMAAVCTDGAAEIGLIVVELATAGFLVADSINCVQACNY